MDTGAMVFRNAALLLVACSILVEMAPPAAGAETRPEAALPSSEYREDLETAWTFVRDNYAYFDRKTTDWERVGTSARARVGSIRNNGEFIGLLETMLEQLYDSHAHLGVNTSSSPRLVPSGTDLWAEHQEGRAILTDVRSGSAAARVGLQPGMEITSIDGRPVAEAVRQRRPTTLREADPAADDWALRAALAGRHDKPVRVGVRGRSKIFAFRPGLVRPSRGVLTVRVLNGNIGSIRIHDSLGDDALIAAWDSALTAVRATRGLVLDLRDTPSGGNSTVARALMSRLVPDTRPYQRHELAAEERQYGVRRIWVEYVAPRGPFIYERPTALLVGRWTGSMGEGVAVGLDGMRRAAVVGTAMAGLRGANYVITLPHSGIEVRVPAERLEHVNGTPREMFVPPVVVKPASGDRDPALKTALDLLRRASDGVEPRSPK